ncbi:hypothetical protein POX_h09817 [Penicillium oxalicum]|uniref:hypothetical protein n=1 Tax=Penicillium oxalicum TaxID=69781 RepID=UPI0020B7672D|nr:hypothetical protein POX_h09817 [Penicillium oxalicum]KAI2786052.1 hypothetical protein POX_h09817 [Penicillium oxalicum]
MIQTEPPYFHPIPKASQPLNTGIFRDDLTFDDCDSGSATCAVSWAAGILDSEPVYMLGAGLYSWFSGYSQDCVKTEKCQQRGFQIEQSNDVWIYNLRTKAIVEMVSPVGELVTRAVDSRNGFLSSILAWVCNSPDTIIGERNARGLAAAEDAWVLGKATLTVFFSASQGQNFTVKSAVTFPARAGGTISTGYNETCLKETNTGAHCNNVIDTFKIVDSYERMPQNELCSQCFVNMNRMMQSSPCSIFQSALESPYLKARLQYIHSTCGIGTGPTHVEDPQYLPIKQHPIPCFTEVVHTSQIGDTCDSVALKYSIASAALQSAKTDYITNCTTLAAGNELCIPLTCDKMYILADTDTCGSIELDAGIGIGNLRAYNPWIDFFCDNLLSTVWVHGRTLCLSPQTGVYMERLEPHSWGRRSFR